MFLQLIILQAAVEVELLEVQRLQEVTVVAELVVVEATLEFLELQTLAEALAEVLTVEINTAAVAVVQVD
jgi:hypothetical protein